MKAIFADTSYFIALLREGDDYHAAAHAFSQTNRMALITTSVVILELGAQYSRVAERRAFLDLLEAVKRARITILHVDKEQQQRGIERFAQRADKNWSLADCISFLLMEDHGITEAASSDEHFEQAGFVALLRTPNRMG